MDIIHNTYIGTKQKALAINLDPKIYGSFAEIGAGQDVAANFFKAGASSGTIAKTMSAYDMTFSDAIYGAQQVKRYVSEQRLISMLEHEYGLLIERLAQLRGDTTTFFAFSATFSALNYHKTNEGHGWMGVRFQLEPNGVFHDVVIHVKLLDNDNNLQQQAVGILGVNLMYACFYYNEVPPVFLLSLMDKVAYVCAAKHAGNYCVTASIDTVDFLHPVEVGELVSLMASVNYVGKTSLVVGIRVISENIKNNSVLHTNTSYFTMVAKDDDNKPVKVPGLILENREQVRRFIEARRRKEIKQSYMKEVEQIQMPDNYEHCIDLLMGERCLVAGE